jgi:hypothetical protein
MGILATLIVLAFVVYMWIVSPIRWYRRCKRTHF